ncbi:hypothetical protein SUNI508_06599 [Seiridium unicorne]|uniref:Uncharacterized protein n=1 Tax=Seiridium unicorne TaxID=138068 RepID=A0ABR2V1H8_9PEZI
MRGRPGDTGAPLPTGLLKLPEGLVLLQDLNCKWRRATDWELLKSASRLLKHPRMRMGDPCHPHVTAQSSQPHSTAHLAALQPLSLEFQHCWTCSLLLIAPYYGPDDLRPSWQTWCGVQLLASLADPSTNSNGLGGGANVYKGGPLIWDLGGWRMAPKAVPWLKLLALQHGSPCMYLLGACFQA